MFVPVTGWTIAIPFVSIGVVTMIDLKVRLQRPGREVVDGEKRGGWRVRRDHERAASDGTELIEAYLALDRSLIAERPRTELDDYVQSSQNES